MMTKKRIISLFLSLMMIFSVLPITDISIFAETDVLDYLTWEIIGEEVIITDCVESISGEVVIPDTIEGYPVTTIGDEAFARSIITSISLPESVTKINQSAFVDCIALKNINLPSNITEIDEWTFAGCYSLENIELPTGITSIGEGAFSTCLNLRTINIPATVTFIENCAFEYCFCLEKISLPESVNTIGSHAFDGVCSLKDIYIYNPDINLESTCILNESTKFAAITVQEYAKCIADFHVEYHTAYLAGATETELADIQLKYGDFYDETDYVEPIISNMTIHSYNESNAHVYAEDYDIFFVPFGDECDHINTEFRDSSEATCIEGGFTGDLYCTDCGIKLAEGKTTSVSNLHVYGEWEILTNPDCTQEGSKIRSCLLCEATEIRQIPKTGHISTENEFCTGCGKNLISGLLTYSIENGEVTITGCAEDVANLVIPKTIEGYPVTTISEFAFSDCYALKELAIPDSVITIEDYAFYQCYGLEKITISASVESIGANTFRSCSRLQNITVDKNNAFYSSDINGVLFNKDKTQIIKYPEYKSRTEYTIPDGVIIIGDHAFDSSVNLLKINIPYGITTIGYVAFDDSGVKIIELPDSVTTIDLGAFNGCRNLESITILNPECTIFDYEDTIYSEAIIYGYTGSTAQAYAEQYNRTFIAIEDIPCSHDYITTVTPPTCEEQGYTTYTCSICGDTYTENITATGHDWDIWTTVTPATCETDGLEKRVCKNDASHIEENIIPAPGHNFSDEWTIDIPATCESVGSMSHHCSKCSATTDVTVVPKKDHILQHSSVPSTCTVAGVEYDFCLTCFNMFNYNPLPLAEHTWSDWFTVTEPDCLTSGLEKRICSVCETAEENVLPTGGHDYVATVTPPSCEVQGYTTYTCSVCGDTYTDDYVDATDHDWDVWTTVTPATCETDGLEKRVCKNDASHFEENIIPAISHNWNEGVINPASTCNTHGTKTYTCLNDSNHTYTEEVALDADNHIGATYIRDEKDATCSEDGYTGDTYCADCNVKLTDGEVIPATGHDWDNWTTVTPATCETDGLEKRVCKNDASHIEENIIPAPGHNFSDEWTIDIPATCESVGSMSHHCSKCSATTDVTVVPKKDHILQHSSVPSTCTVAGVEYDFCLTCFNMFNYNSLPLAEHTWSDWFTVTEPDCLTSGLEKRICSVCETAEENVLPTGGHDYVATVTPPSCETQGYTTYTCSVCGDTYTDDYVDATGHDWSEWTQTVAPTFINFGEETRTCETCSKTETNILGKLVPDNEVVNEETGVSVSVRDDTYDGELTVDVSPVYDGESYQIINAQIGNFAATIFDITTYVNGEKTQPAGVVLVKIPIPAGYNPDSLIVYYLPNDGSAPEKMNSYVEGGYIFFETTHFSEYVIIDESQTETDDTTACDCNCHSSNVFVKFFYKIARFFWKLFGMEEKRICACGVAHW